MAVNRYASICYHCLGKVPAKGGKLERVNGGWLVSHLACSAAGRSEVIVTEFSSGAVVTQNRRGRCEDAPCCGCCSA